MKNQDFIDRTLELCLSLSDDLNFKYAIEKLTHKETCKFLEENGFKLIKPKKEIKNEPNK